MGTTERGHTKPYQRRVNEDGSMIATPQIYVVNEPAHEGLVKVTTYVETPGSITSKTDYLSYEVAYAEQLGTQPANSQVAVEPIEVFVAAKR